MFSELAVVRDLGCWAGCVGREVGRGEGGAAAHMYSDRGWSIDVLGETGEEDNTFQTLFVNVQNVKSAIFPIKYEEKWHKKIVENLGYLGGVQENRISMREQLEVSLGTLNTLS